jgi:hypothetical protein
MWRVSFKVKRSKNTKPRTLALAGRLLWRKLIDRMEFPAHFDKGTLLA